jgi:aryl-alcohol dehydrogenase-like predicted oxidoreductase
VPYSSVGGHGGHRRLQQYPVLVRIAAKHSTTIYAIALKWLLEKGPHILPIPGATKISSVENSLSAEHVLLDSDDVTALDALS